MARERYAITDERRFNALRNYVLDNLMAVRLYGILNAEGKRAFAKDVTRVIKASFSTALSRFFAPVVGRVF